MYVVSPHTRATSFVSNFASILILTVGFLFLLWFQIRRGTVRSLKSIIRFSALSKGLFVVGFVLVVGAQIFSFLAGKWPEFGDETFTVLLVTTFAFLLAYFATAMLLNIQLNLLLHKFFRVGDSIDDPEVCQAVRSRVQTMFWLHGMLFGCRRTTSREVLDRVCRADREN